MGFSNIPGSLRLYIFQVPRGDLDLSRACILVYIGGLHTKWTMWYVSDDSLLGVCRVHVQEVRVPDASIVAIPVALLVGRTFLLI